MLGRFAAHPNNVCNSPHGKFRVVPISWYSAFALDYTLDVENLTLSVSGLQKPILLIDPGLDLVKSEEQVNVTARAGDQDGANLPWFDYADATLLYWWIHRDTIDAPLKVFRSEDNGVHRLDLQVAQYSRGSCDPLLSIQVKRNDSTIVATVPAKPVSSSPSRTYPIRVALLAVVAPVAVLLNEVVTAFLNVFGDVLVITFVVGVYGFMILAMLVSLWRCVGGPTLATTVEGVQGRLEKWKEYERLRLLRLDAVQDRLDQLYHNERIKAFLHICANGWHPEREAEKAAEQQQLDIEKADSKA